MNTEGTPSPGDRPALGWLPGGLMLGGLLLVAVASVQPLGVSTQYVRAVGGLAELCAPGGTESNAYLRKEKVVFGYAEALVVGIPLGAFLASSASGRRKRRDVPSVWSERFGPSRARRFLAAAAGGFLLLFGARLAGGCTSGHVLSGVSQLAVSSIVFAVAAFGTGALVARGLYPPSGGRR